MLKEHYLLEDWPAVLNEIENLLNVSTKLLNASETADFSSKESILQSINGSLITLRALNAKKVHRDQFELSGTARRHWS